MAADRSSYVPSGPPHQFSMPTHAPQPLSISSKQFAPVELPGDSEYPIPPPASHPAVPIPSKQFAPVELPAEVPIDAAQANSNGSFGQRPSESNPSAAYYPPPPPPSTSISASPIPSTTSPPSYVPQTPISPSNTLTPTISISSTSTPFSQASSENVLTPATSIASSCGPQSQSIYYPPWTPQQNDETPTSLPMTPGGFTQPADNQPYQIHNQYPLPQGDGYFPPVRPNQNSIGWSLSQSPTSQPYSSQHQAVKSGYTNHPDHNGVPLPPPPPPPTGLFQAPPTPQYTPGTSMSLETQFSTMNFNPSLPTPALSPQAQVTQGQYTTPTNYFPPPPPLPSNNVPPPLPSPSQFYPPLPPRSPSLQPLQLSQTPAFSPQIQYPPPPFMQYPPPPTSPLTPALTPPAASSNPMVSPSLEEQKTSFGKRFVGNSLAGRVVRASVKTVTTAVALPTTLSPWGDNNFVTLPNIRKRDAALAVFAHVGADALGPSALELTGNVVKFAGTQAAEATIDETHAKLRPGKAVPHVKKGGITSLQVRIKHKLMGVDAELRFIGQRPAKSLTACEKGWFSPYLFASGRTPCITRATDFSIVTFHGPGLKADVELAPKLLPILASESPILSLCDSDPSHNPPYPRLLILPLGLSPYRSEAWSQARVPNEARLALHLLSAASALVIPVLLETPICAWSPWTIKQVYASGQIHGQLSADEGAGYTPERHYEELFSYLETIISVLDIDEIVRNDWKRCMGTGLQSVIQGLVDTRGMQKADFGPMDISRAGLVMFRY